MANTGQHKSRDVAVCCHHQRHLSASFHASSSLNKPWRRTEIILFITWCSDHSPYAVVSSENCLSFWYSQRVCFWPSGWTGTIHLASDEQRGWWEAANMASWRTPRWRVYGSGLRWTPSLRAKDEGSKLTFDLQVRFSCQQRTLAPWTPPTCRASNSPLEPAQPSISIHTAYYSVIKSIVRSLIDASNI